MIASSAPAVERFRIGLVPHAETDLERARVAALVTALGDAIDARVEIVRAGGYGDLVERLERGDVSLAWVPPIAAARAVKAGSVRPVVVAVRGGVAGYSTALVTRADGTVRSLADLRGASVGWVDRTSAGGYLVVRAALRHAGLDLERTFSEEHFLGSHAAVAAAVLEGRVEVGATYFGFHPGTTEIARAGWRPLAPSRAVRVLAHAGPIPSDFLAAHEGIDPAVVRAVQAVLLDGRAPRALELAKAVFQVDGFVLPSQEHLAMLRGLLAAVEA